MADLRDLRKTYERDTLTDDRAAADPLDQFAGWMREALDAGVPEPNAMTVATVGADGRPSSRVVLIKSFDAEGIVWYTNYESRKGRELDPKDAEAILIGWRAVRDAMRAG